MLLLNRSNTASSLSAAMLSQHELSSVHAGDDSLPFPGHQQKVFCSAGREKLWKSFCVTEAPAREVSTP